MKIVPSILTNTADEFCQQIKNLGPYYNQFQIDVADGRFVPNKTVPIEKIIPILRDFDSKIKDLKFDFHLMVKDYQKEIKKLDRLKKLITVKNILIHFSAILDFSVFPIGLVLNPQDQVRTLANRCNLEIIPYLQIMSVNPGFQGSPFLPQTLKKIEQLRLLGYRNKIFLDGAVNDKTMPIILSKKFRPDVLCPGSFLSKAGKELKKRVAYLKNLTRVS